MDKDIIYSRSVLEMITVANEYCIYINEIDAYNQDQILAYLHRICPLLYLKGSLLPHIEIDADDEQINERFVTQEQWETVFNSIRNKIKSIDEFLVIAPHEKLDFNPVKYSIAELLADVFQDLKDFIWLYQKTTLNAKGNAISSCKLLFEQNWGFKISLIQNALHSIIYGQSDNIILNE